MLDAGDDAEAVVRRYRPEEPASTSRALSHDDEDAILAGQARPRACPAAILDDGIERGRLRGGSVEKAKDELDLVARRVNIGRGSVVHLCTADQAAELEA